MTASAVRKACDEVTRNTDPNDPCKWPVCNLACPAGLASLPDFLTALIAAAREEGAKNATAAASRMIKRRLDQNKRMALAQGDERSWAGVIHQAQDFLNGLQSDAPPGHAIRARSAAGERG